jgi:hypothetical protein
MGKVILEFDSIEEQDDIQSALNGYKWKLAMNDLDDLLRETEKYDKSLVKPYGPDLATDIEYEIAAKLRETIREILFEYGLKFD